LECGSSGAFFGGGNFGVHWQDGAQAGSVPTSVIVQLAHGVQCTQPLALGITFNGIAAGTYTLPADDCFCDPTPVAETITLPGQALAAYSAGGLNTLSIASAGASEGFMPINGTIYATVTVTF
jgi:hypothetical protein